MDHFVLYILFFDAFCCSETYRIKKRVLIHSIPSTQGPILEIDSSVRMKVMCMHLIFV